MTCAGCGCEADKVDFVDTFAMCEQCKEDYFEDHPELVEGE